MQRTSTWLKIRIMHFHRRFQSPCAKQKDMFTGHIFDTPFLNVLTFSHLLMIYVPIYSTHSVAKRMAWSTSKIDSLQISVLRNVSLSISFQGLIFILLFGLLEFMKRLVSTFVRQGASKYISTACRTVWQWFRLHSFSHLNIAGYEGTDMSSLHKIHDCSLSMNEQNLNLFSYNTWWYLEWLKTWVLEVLTSCCLHWLWIKIKMNQWVGELMSSIGVWRLVTLVLSPNWKGTTKFNQWIWSAWAYINWSSKSWLQLSQDYKRIIDIILLLKMTP